MAYVPEDAEWFIASLVVEIRVAGHKRNIVHINYVIVRAKSQARPAEEGPRGIPAYKEASGSARLQFMI